MLTAVLLMSMLAMPQAPQTPAPATPAEAAALAREGQHEAALEAFRRFVSANPRDHASRIWIARLHNLMGHPELAEPVYRSVMLEDPANVEAILGTGLTLLTLHRTEDAIEVLERAERAQPQNPDVLDALSRAHTLSGEPDRAVAYAERAVQIAPSETHRLTLEQARGVDGHRVELTSFGENYNTTASNTGSVDLRVNFRVNDDFRVVARGQHQRKFGFSEQRGGAGLEWRWRPRTSLVGHVLFGPDDNVVLPRVDVNGEILHTDGPTLWVAGYRFFDFPSAQVSVLSPGVTWWPADRVSLTARYYLTLGDFPLSSGVQDDHSFWLRSAYRVVPRVWINAGYAHGTENFDTLSPDRLGDFDANTVSGGLRVDLPSFTSIVGGYEYQWRPQSVEMQRLTVSLLQRF